MVAGIFHSGSGCGNQLHRYVATRVLALDKGLDFSMVAPENFKGSSFMNLNMGVKSKDPRDLSFVPYQTEMPAGKCVPISDMPLWEEKTNYYNPEFNFIGDNTIIDGEFQDERYFEHRLRKINEWLKVEPLDIPDDTCVINFRGGEFSLFPELFLTQDYWDEAVKIMREQGVQKFEVHTDDPPLASQFFPEFPIVPNLPISHSKHTNMGYNWRSLRYAKYAIIANSSFPILPRLLKHRIDYIGASSMESILGGFKPILTIAPRYWARRNTKVWALPQNYYKQFMYI